MIFSSWHLDFGRVPCVYDYCTRLDFEGITSWYQSRLPVGHPFQLLGRSRVYLLQNYFANIMFGLRAHIVITTCDIYGIRIIFLLTYALGFYLLILAGKVYYH